MMERPEILRRRWWRTKKFLLGMRLKVMMGQDVRIHSEERRILEETIIPYFAAREDIHKVLFVGCNPYTAHYVSLWPKKEYWTIDIDAKQRRFGAANHIVDSVENLMNHFEVGYFNLILLNGVIGFGVNTLAAAERTVNACAAALCEGGELLVGWNQSPPYNPVEADKLEALESFQPNLFPPLGDWRFVCYGDMLHTYDFYIKGRETGRKKQ
jgi:hypothetical protein